MAELTITTFLSLDGVMQAPGGPGEDESGDFTYGGWLVPHADVDMRRTMTEIFSRADAFLLGRGTYDIFSAYWPRVTDPGDLIASKLNSLPKSVPSCTKSAFTWNNTTHVRDVVKEVIALKQQKNVCGWLQDKYGVSWQIVPAVLGEMLQDKDTERTERVMKTMLQMTKIDIKALQGHTER